MLSKAERRSRSGTAAESVQSEQDPTRYKAFLFRRTSLIKFGDLFLLRMRALWRRRTAHTHTHTQTHIRSGRDFLFVLRIGCEPQEHSRSLNKVKKLHLFPILAPDPFSNKTDYPGKERRLRFLFFLSGILTVKVQKCSPLLRWWDLKLKSVKSSPVSSKSRTTHQLIYYVIELLRFIILMLIVDKDI